MFLTSTTRSFEFFLSNSVTTTQLSFLTTYVDINRATQELLTSDQETGFSNDTTEVVLLSAPEESVNRCLKEIFIKNRDTVATTVLIQYNDDGAITELVEIQIPVNRTLQYNTLNGWFLTP